MHHHFGLARLMGENWVPLDRMIEHGLHQPTKTPVDGESG